MVGNQSIRDIGLRPPFMRRRVENIGRKGGVSCLPNQLGQTLPSHSGTGHSKMYNKHFHTPALVGGYQVEQKTFAIHADVHDKKLLTNGNVIYARQPEHTQWLMDQDRAGDWWDQWRTQLYFLYIYLRYFLSNKDIF